MEFNCLKHSMNEGVALLVLNRPEALNALNTKVFDEINAYLDHLESQEGVRALIVTGEGKAFVAGADIAEMAGKGREEALAFSQYGQRTFSRFEDLDIPVIAAVNGFALGGGCELTMSCDFRIASSKAKFGQPEVNLGLIPGFAGTQRLARLCGIGNALYLLMTAEMIDATEALRIGLVQKVTDPETLMEEALKIAARLASNGSAAICRVKQVTRTGINLDFEMGSDMEAQEFADLFEDPKTKEGIQAFLEKRKPDW